MKRFSYYTCSMRRAIFILLWLLTDIAVFLGSYALAYFLRVGFILSSDFSFAQYMQIVLLVSPFWLLALITTRTFALLRKQRSLKTLLYIVYACTMGASLFALLYFFSYGLFFSRLLLLEALLLSIVCTWVWHLAFGYLTRHMMRRSATYPTLIIGATREAARLIQALKKNRSPLTPVVIIDPRTKEKAVHGVPVAGRFHKLEEAMRTHKVTHVIQCSDLEQSLNVISLCRSRHITFMLLPSVLGIVEGDERVDILEGHAVTVVDPGVSSLGAFFQ